MSNDAKIKQLKAVVDKKVKDLGSAPIKNFKTSMLYPIKYGNEFSTNKVNLNTLTTRNALFEVAADLAFRKESRVQAAAILGDVDLLDIPLEVHGYPIEDWQHDLKILYRTIVYKKELAELKALESKLQSLMSEEAKTESELDDIAKLLA